MIDTKRQRETTVDFKDVPRWLYVEALDEIDSLREELERERLRLAACGVVALANTPEAAEQARACDAAYRSASFDDVADAVDREMDLRSRVAALEGAARDSNEALRYVLELIEDGQGDDETGLLSIDGITQDFVEGAVTYVDALAALLPGEEG